MRYGVLSDIHGNLEALQAVLAACQKDGVEAFLHVGDIVGYGGNPKECLALLRQLEMTSVAGNHDWAVAGKIDPMFFNPAAKEAVYWTKKQLSPEEIGFLSDLNAVYRNDDLILTHGTLMEPERFHYLKYLSQANETFDLMDRDLCFIGHTHTPQIIIQRARQPETSDALTIRVEEVRQYIINVGSVGQPRDGNSMAAYCLYDNESQIVEVKRIPYDIKLAQKKILDVGLPSSLASRLSVGH